MDESPASKRSLLGEGLRRLLDEREEPRSIATSQTAMLDHGGRRHVVRLVDLSQSGAMLGFQGTLVDGDDVTLHLLDHGAVRGQVRWSRDGRVGINFSNPLDLTLDQE
ncbi:PilZ domain-containing protein [Sphingomonas sp.]|uniref:PilZ domain-containing protein n=1 Tax=Sphingomonas sp. TaxID=28214 RepID=UPI00286C7EDA|nr:PilZ domain-containing protein [Sphingomonas sp.]